MTPQEHKLRAEQLLDEGVAVVNKIATADADCPPSMNANHVEKWIATRRDELGKKVMGIWAQAQVHATLATVAAADSVTVKAAPAGRAKTVVDPVA